VCTTSANRTSNLKVVENRGGSAARDGPAKSDAAPPTRKILFARCASRLRTLEATRRDPGREPPLLAR
jgi:hypothetical protein